jgi:hypothetical protein
MVHTARCVTENGDGQSRQAAQGTEEAEAAEEARAEGVTFGR